MDSENATYPVELTPVLRKAIMEAKQRGDEAAAALQLTAAYVLLSTLNAELDRLVLLAKQVQGVDEAARLDLGRGWVMPGKTISP